MKLLLACLLGLAASPAWAGSNFTAVVQGPATAVTGTATQIVPPGAKQFLSICNLSSAKAATAPATGYVPASTVYFSMTDPAPTLTSADTQPLPGQANAPLNCQNWALPGYVPSNAITALSDEAGGDASILVLYAPGPQ